MLDDVEEGKELVEQCDNQDWHKEDGQENELDNKVHTLGSEGM